MAVKLDDSVAGLTNVKDADKVAIGCKGCKKV